MPSISNMISSKLNTYDHFGYILVGSLGLLLLAFDLWYLDIPKYIPLFSLQNSLIWLIASYFFGHLSQAFANLFIFEDKEDFSDNDKIILDEARSYFALEQISNRETYKYCNLFAYANDISGQVTSFHAYYGLYRGWFIILLLESGFFAVIFIISWFDIVVLLHLLGSVLITLIINQRRLRFWKFLKIKTLQTFVVVRKINNN